jgi:chemotaxis protein methyltransferase WspC
MIRIEQHLREKIGLDPGSIGSSSIHRVVRLRMKTLGIGAVDDYRKMLQKSWAEWTELLEAIVVTETWFFRDGAPFNAGVRLVAEQWLSRPGASPLRVLSVPCSSGEEPYSLVMALMDAGIPAERFQIDAADISPRALNRARRGIYGRNSFRGKDLSFRDRYFHHTKEGYVLCPPVRNAVRFFEGNILSPNFLPGGAAYDVIFCRNLLIYFDRETQTRALNAISRLLSPAGILMVGAAEQPLALENGFVSANIPLAFACRKSASVPGAAIKHWHSAKLLKLPPPPEDLLQSSALEWETTTSARARRAQTESQTAKPARAGQSADFGGAPPVMPDLTHARRLADEGNLKEAASMCRAHLQLDAACAQAWYLLGLVHDANGDPLAEECYRKALYLDPNHYETLLQMALLAEKSGDLNRAQNFRQRAARVKPVPATTSEPTRV